MYGHVHVSMLFSQIIPPVPSPQSPKVCSFHLCLFCCPACRILMAISPYCMHMHSYTEIIFVFLFLNLHHSVEQSPVSLTCLEWTKMHSFSQLSIVHRVYIPPLSYPFICSGYLDCFHVLAIVNSRGMNIGVHMSLSVLLSLGCMQAVGFLGHMMVLFPGF